MSGLERGLRHRTGVCGDKGGQRQLSGPTNRRGNQACMLFLFLKGHCRGTKAFSPWAPYEEFLNFHWSISIKSTKAMTKGHGGNRFCCLREVSGLGNPQRSFRTVIVNDR